MHIMYLHEAFPGDASRVVNQPPPARRQPAHTVGGCVSKWFILLRKQNANQKGKQPGTGSRPPPANGEQTSDKRSEPAPSPSCTCDGVAKGRNPLLGRRQRKGPSSAHPSSPQDGQIRSPKREATTLAQPRSSLPYTLPTSLSLWFFSHEMPGSLNSAPVSCYCLYEPKLYHHIIIKPCT